MPRCIASSMLKFQEVSSRVDCCAKVEEAAAEKGWVAMPLLPTPRLHRLEASVDPTMPPSERLA